MHIKNTRSQSVIQQSTESNSKFESLRRTRSKSFNMQPVEKRKVEKKKDETLRGVGIDVLEYILDSNGTKVLRDVLLTIGVDVQTELEAIQKLRDGVDIPGIDLKIARMFFDTQYGTHEDPTIKSFLHLIALSKAYGKYPSDIQYDDEVINIAKQFYIYDIF